MKEKLGKNTKIIILVVCIMLTIIGVAYSYLAPLISGVETESTISFNSGMIKITYNGSNVITGENIIPGWSETKEFTVVGSNNTSITQKDIMDYQIKLVVEENTFSDGAIRFELTGSSSNDADTLSPLFGKVPTGTGETLLGTARFNQDDNIKNDVIHSYSLLIGFPNDPDKNQSNDWGKSFSGYVVVEEGSLQEQELMLATNYVENLYNNSIIGLNDLRYDDTSDKNLRYVGSDPNNYVSFNNELWRIIGIFDEGVKLIRDEAITDADGNIITYWSSVTNDWTTSILQTYLNEDYYNSLSATSQSQIKKTTWIFGGYTTGGDYKFDLATFYERERNNFGNYNEWIGNIALMYPSDWGYASANKLCRENINSYDSSGSLLCSNSNWLYKTELYNTFYEWTLTPSFYSNLPICVGSYGVSDYLCAYNLNITLRPTLYLTSTTKITGGTGTSSNPYQISL